MAEKIETRIKPIGAAPSSELDWFEVCPVCGKIIDVRNLDEVFGHTHDENENAAPPIQGRRG